MAAVPSLGRASEVERSAAPEADATRALYERYAGQIFGFCLHRLGSREDAEDAVQTTFMNAFRGLRRGIVPEAEAAWLFKIAENVCLTRKRSTWRRGRVESPSDMQALQDVLPARETDGDELIPLGDALAAMPETQRRAILLREWQGLSYREIAEELGVSQSAVETLIFRARRSLANALETPWQERRVRAAGRRAFDLGSLFAGLKALLVGSTAAKVAVVAIAATGTAAVAVAENRHPSPSQRPVEPSVAAARAPDSSARRPRLLLAPAASAPIAAAATAPKPKASKAAQGVAERSKREAKPAPAGQSTGERVPPGQAKKSDLGSGPPERAARPSKAKPEAKPKVKLKPQGAKPKATTPANTGQERQKAK